MFSAASEPSLPGCGQAAARGAYSCDRRDEFGFWWDAAGEWVEPPNQRRNGWSGMSRCLIDGRLMYVKRQSNHLYRSVTRPRGEPTASREWRNLLLLRKLGIETPEPVFHGTRKGRSGIEAVLVTRELSGYTSLDDIEINHPAVKASIALTLGAMLGRLHSARLQHGCLYGKHVMIRADSGGTIRIALIDLEKMRFRLTRRQAAAHDLAQLYRRQRFLTPDEWRVLVDAHSRSLTGLPADP